MKNVLTVQPKHEIVCKYTVDRFNLKFNCLHYFHIQFQHEVYPQI